MPIPHRVPLLVRLPDAPCLVVGGGGVARRKATWLLGHGLSVEMLAPELDALGWTPAENAGIGGTLHIRSGAYAGLQGRPYALVVAATDDPALNARIADDARAASIPVNCVDDPDRSDVLFPATHADGAVELAVTTHGHAPALASRLRTLLAAHLPPGVGAFAEALGSARTMLRMRCPDTNVRQAMLKAWASEPIPEEPDPDLPAAWLQEFEQRADAPPSPPPNPDAPEETP